MTVTDTITSAPGASGGADCARDTARGRQQLTAVISVAVAAVLLLLLALFPGLGSAAAHGSSDRLRSGDRLHVGQLLRSPNGSHTLEVQRDGNLVVYGPGHRPLWATGSSGKHVQLVNQRDGNIVLIAQGNRPLWSTGTSGIPHAALLMQNDGNLVVYAPGNRPAWASRHASSQPSAPLFPRVRGVLPRRAAQQQAKAIAEGVGYLGLICGFSKYADDIRTKNGRPLTVALQLGAAAASKATGADAACSGAAQGLLAAAHIIAMSHHGDGDVSIAMTSKPNMKWGVTYSCTHTFTVGSYSTRTGERTFVRTYDVTIPMTGC